MKPPKSNIVSEKILSVLRCTGALTMTELVMQVQKTIHVRSSEIKAAVLPLVNINQIELRPDLKMQLSEQYYEEQEAKANGGCDW